MNDDSWLILKRIIILMFISIIRGSLIIWLIFPTPPIICLPIYLKLLTICVCIIGGLFGYIISDCSFYFLNKSLKLNYLTWFIRNIWFLPTISTIYINYPF